jgi:imidazoleglycerol phosphate synthase glutamine amidotransferase subunit HisH
VLFQSSEENPGVEGLALIPTPVRKYESHGQDLFLANRKPPRLLGLAVLMTFLAHLCRFRFEGEARPPSVPHMGWNGIRVRSKTTITPNPTDEVRVGHKCWCGQWCL